MAKVDHNTIKKLLGLLAYLAIKNNPWSYLIKSKVVGSK